MDDGWATDSPLQSWVERKRYAVGSTSIRQRSPRRHFQVELGVERSRTQFDLPAALTAHSGSEGLFFLPPSPLLPPAKPGDPVPVEPVEPAPAPDPDSPEPIHPSAIARVLTGQGRRSFRTGSCCPCGASCVEEAVRRVETEKWIDPWRMDG